jgi:TATA-box binding protein (TBP) (component of TFIID and TFIIIB)
MGDPVKAVLIFSSGKVVFTGAQYRDQINKAFQMLLEEMKPYYKT